MTAVQNFIDGQLVDSVSGATMPLVDPSTGEQYGTAPISNHQDIDNAYASAARAFNYWKRTTPSHRSGQQCQPDGARARLLRRHPRRRHRYRGR